MDRRSKNGRIGALWNAPGLVNQNVHYPFCSYRAMDLKGKKKTVFTAHFRALFAMKNSPAAFQCAINMIFAVFRWYFCLLNIDGVMVFAKTFDKHLKNVNTKVR